VTEARRAAAPPRCRARARPPTDLAGIGGMGPDNAGGGLDPDSGVPPDAAAPGNEDADGCDVGVADASRAPAALALSGNLGAHDPVIIAAHGQYYYFSTGNGISAKVSPDLLAWSQLPAVFPQTPAWFQASVPAFTGRNIWAPDISFFGGQYHLYYCRRSAVTAPASGTRRGLRWTAEPGRITRRCSARTSRGRTTTSMPSIPT
jgi:hypothetical protein